MTRAVAFFFFQAEDGIRDWSVTGVQTCALPIYAGEVTLMVTDPAAPGASDRDEAESVPVQPGRTESVIAKEEVVHGLTSLLVTDTVNVTCVPDLTAADCPGDIETRGATCEQLAAGVG